MNKKFAQFKSRSNNYLNRLVLKKLFLTLFISTSVLAHEGDHGPSMFQAQKNGIVQSLESVNLELVKDNDTLKLYAYDLKGKSTDVKKFPIKSRILLPLKKTAPIDLVAKGIYWEGIYKAPNTAHRFTLELTIEQGGHKDVILFTIDQEIKK